MTSISGPILFFGTEDFSLTALQSLVENDYDIRAVITKPDSLRGRGHTLTMPAVKHYAQHRGITVWQPQKLSEIADDIRALGRPAGVLVSYGKIIPQSIIDLFIPGIINLHPSLLPRYRGPSPIESAILHGDTETGVSIMQLSARMDAGPVYTTASLPLTGQETRSELYQSLGELGSRTLLASLPAILSGDATPLPQDESAATYCQLLTKSDGLLDPTTQTAEDAERRVRAFLGFPKTRIMYDDTALIVTKARIAGAPKTPLDAVFTDGNYLVIDEVIAPSGKTMPTSDFLRGHSHA